jgi:hypothetical protein
MEQYKKDVLSGLLKKLSDEIGVLYHKLEDDQENISEEKYREYEKHIENLYEIHNSLSEEIYFS